MHVYLNLKALLLDGGHAAERLSEALAPQHHCPPRRSNRSQARLHDAFYHCGGALTLTLDLFEIETALERADERKIAGEIAEVLCQHAASHAFCICRCSHRGTWQEAVGHSRLSRLLSWPAFSVQPGQWRVLGQPLQAMDAAILNHLCRQETSTPEQIALDAQVVSQRLRITSSTLRNVAVQQALGRVPQGPDGRGGPSQPDVWEIERRLGSMHRAGLVTGPSPSSHGYRIVRPTPPHGSVRTTTERIPPV